MVELINKVMNEELHGEVKISKQFQHNSVDEIMKTLASGLTAWKQIYETKNDIIVVW